MKNTFDNGFRPRNLCYKSNTTVTNLSCFICKTCCVVIYRKEEARRALQWFRGKQYDVDDELTKALDTIHKEEQNKTTLGDMLSSRGTVRALIVSVGLMAFQQFSGINAVIFYSGKIFEASGSAMSATTSSIVIGIVQVQCHLVLFFTIILLL